jgi:sortase A
VIRSTVRGFGQLLITFGLVVMLFAAYEVYGKALEAGAEQKQLAGGLNAAWANEPPRAEVALPKPVKGKGMARLYIPRLNKEWVVVEGTDPADIRLAPGHYPKSALPGQKGNFAIAGHRMPSVFWDLDKMRNGDAMVIETKNQWIVYTVSRVHIVLPTEIGVVAPNPDRPVAASGSRRLITLTTCNPKWDNYERLIVQGEVARQQSKTAGERPAELAGMKG